MLTADLVRATRKNGELKLSSISATLRKRALELAAAYIELFELGVGQSRDALEEALEAVEVTPRERLLARGLRKLLEDRSTFEAAPEVDPPALRQQVFRLAASRLGALGDGERLDRAEIFRSVASERALSISEVERALFADLRSEHLLETFEPVSPAGLVSAWEVAQAQAVLLKAVRVTVEVLSSSPLAYRSLFRKLKFLRLLYTLERMPSGGYRIEVDGPFSLFEQVTKYGLALAMMVPALESLDHYRLVAAVRWGPERHALSFRWEGGAREDATPSASELTDEVSELMDRFARLETRWRVRVSEALLDAPGLGLLVPDLVFERDDGVCVFFEAVGHWSRASVWRRVELIERGLDAPLVIAVSARLRVSEEALDGELPAALYVYKGTMSARAVLEKIEAIAERRGRA